MPKDTQKDAQTCQELLLEFKNKNPGIKGEKLIFSGVDGNDVYNITAPFENEGEIVIAGRVESRDSEFSKVMFFSYKDGLWSPLKNSRVFNLQDPFHTRVFGEMVLGGVEVWPKPDDLKRLNWRTVFYKGENINNLKLFANGPVGMKDIRLVGLKSGRVGVFTRPQGEIGGRGQIGFTTINSLDELNDDVITRAQLIEGLFNKDEWGGANEPHLLSNGLIGVLGHIACFDRQDNRHYYAMVFSFNPDTGETSPVKIIATRDDFPAGEAKRQDLVDVIFSGGLVRLGDGKAVLYAGVSDAEAHRIVIPDPFLEYEK